MVQTGQERRWVPHTPYHRIQVTDDVAGLVGQLGDQGGVRDGLLLVQGGADGDALIVDDDDADHALVGRDALERLLNFTLWGQESVRRWASEGEEGWRKQARGEAAGRGAIEGSR